MIPGFRSLKMPAVPDRSAPDYQDQVDRHWRESEVWWDNWAANYVRAMALLAVAGTIAVFLVLILVP